MMRKSIIVMVIAAFCIVPVALGAFISTSMGEQAVVTPQLRILSPDKNFKAGEPIPVKVAYQNFDMRPDLRCSPAGPCAGSTPQVLSNGLVQGHVHVYFQRVTGQFSDVGANSFCIPATVVPDGLGGGTISGTCAALPKGDYRVSAEFQSNSHIALLKARPQDVPTTDTFEVKANG